MTGVKAAVCPGKRRNPVSERHLTSFKQYDRDPSISLKEHSGISQPKPFRSSYKPEGIKAKHEKQLWKDKVFFFITHFENKVEMCRKNTKYREQS